MTAYQTFCLIDYADGYRTVITVEDGSEDAPEVARIVIVHDGGKPLEIGLSTESAEGLIAELQRRMIAEVDRG